MITNQESILPLVGLILAFVLIFLGLAYRIKKKETMGFLLLFTMGLLVIALLFPWWSLQGSSSNIETSSTFYLIPLNLVSITTTPQAIVGELSFFPEIFITIMTIIPILTIIVCLLAVSVLVVKKFQNKQWQPLLLIGACAILLGSLVLFIVAMSAFTEVGVGSLIGNGTLDISIQGTEELIPVSCQWGPGIGFWLYIASAALLLVSLIVQLYLKKKKNT